MTAAFYNYRGKNNTIFKNLEYIESRTIKPYNSFDDENPMLILDYIPAIENANYCVIDGVCYFVEIPSKDIGSRMVLQLSKDLLGTYKEALGACNVITDRNTEDYNSYIADGAQKTQVNYTTFSIPLGSLGFTGNSPVIISLIGGSAL